ncbi:hypothetical protein BDW59DRAFT_146241 [Aspergillus cavernicola]|uniref:Secreted protein n=1 Tax=Aspergillus cavernicola TaxID=176166 RepID=A0ABR4ICK1_9EURO
MSIIVPGKYLICWLSINVLLTKLVCGSLRKADPLLRLALLKSSVETSVESLKILLLISSPECCHKYYARKVGFPAKCRQTTGRASSRCLSAECDCQQQTIPQ